jgi:hypothetical protein
MINNAVGIKITTIISATARGGSIITAEIIIIIAQAGEVSDRSYAAVFTCVLKVKV